MRRLFSLWESFRFLRMHLTFMRRFSVFENAFNFHEKVFGFSHLYAECLWYPAVRGRLQPLLSQGLSTRTVFIIVTHTVAQKHKKLTQTNKQCTIKNIFIPRQRRNNKKIKFTRTNNQTNKQCTIKKLSRGLSTRTVIIIITHTEAQNKVYLN